MNIASDEPNAAESAESRASRVESPKPDRSSALSTTRSALCYFIFFLSGAAALVYEISWSRQIGLLFGHTVHAAAVVLASYFAGMAVGHVIGARWSSRVSPLLGYGIAEFVVAGWACLIPLLLSLSEAPEIASWLSSSSFAWQTAVRVVFAFLLLLPATTALGATLPMMAEFLTLQSSRDIADSTNAARVSLAYALNTAGALVGVLSATFFMLVLVGVRTSSYVAAGVSAACAIAGSRVESQESRAGRYLSSSSRLLSLDSRLFWLFLAALSGFGTLALEVLYTRMFSLVFHNSTYTFGAVVAVFLGSLALGAALAARLQSRYRLVGLAGWASGSGALATAFSVLVFVGLTDLDYYSYGESFSQYLTGAFVLVVLVVAPPITLLGMLLPFAWKAAGGADRAGQVVGWLTAANTIAAAAGALAASFLLLPWIGLWQSFVLLGASFLVVGLALLLRSGRPVWACVGAVVFGALALVALRSPIEPNHNRTQPGEQLVRRWSSPYGWIDVVRHEKTGAFRVRQNLHYRFGRTGGNAREYRQTHIPLLLHEQPRDVLFMGLGTGLTAGGAIPHREVENIVAVELIPEVVEAARLLAEHNYGVVDHEKVEIRVDDARHYLLATDRRFDVIVSDLFVPWESESGYLYTVEHYRVARQRLKPGGLFCQWLPLYQVGAREFELIADSFASVFPVTTIWWGEMDAARPVIALVGSDAPIEIVAGRLAARLATLRRTARSSDENLHTVERFWSNYQGDWTPGNSSRLNTDEHPRVEFLTPVSNRDQKLLNGTRLLEYFDAVLAQLPSQAARFRPAAGATRQTSQQRRARQRLVLFGK
ncbi:MAG: fused MFS/spermidine synthase [Planctomycetaceae bacterium]|nr:fused MFS/spermidine synthase [Planctomycetales bacterium]MCB9920975.1 fused MFS/spermidine synthase [Planctomycetaceae bacterium]